MNWKKLLSIGSLTMFSASIATGQGTAPTIVQGDYISNVFGNSNFIKNPNAKLNNKDVTVSSATVTRSTTTPLVATSEFLVTTSTSTGSATWSTRTFDSGMKGQNCEARFSYRGFSVGSTTAQILQGANVVAQLTLTPSTDPRIASINFPCGDLSSATTFRLQQASASLTGTNEIGGIYVGLATNMANVAQAENVVQASRASPQQSIPDNTVTDIIFNSEALDIYGEFDTSTGVFTAKRAGNYFISASYRTAFVGWTAGTHYAEIFLFKNTTTLARNYIMADANVSKSMFPQANAIVSLNVGDTLRVKAYIFRGASTNIEPNAGETIVSISRFPSSSELVVTPERQNVFGSVTYRGAGNQVSQFFGSAASTTYSTFTSATWTGYRDFKGTRCEAPSTSANHIGCQIKNMPVGTYKVSVSGLIYETNAAAGNNNCSYLIQETGTSTDVAYITGSQSSVDGGVRYAGRSVIGTFKNTAVADRNFVFRAAKTFDNTAGNTGTCNIFTSNSGNDMSDFNIIIEPLDQPSNSALYVQGPVLSAGTGTASAAGYQGEEVIGTSTSGTGNECAKVTVNPGQWILYGMGYADMTSIGPTPSTYYYDVEIDDTSTVLSGGTGSFQRSWFNSTSTAVLLSTTRIVRTATQKTYYLNCRAGTGVKTNNVSVFKAVRLN